ncbi:uncharacterized protein VTP21DRAFT_1824 [Calcarisporiella thermophila]|uniref:uncharacterized protein n=1 Tax=Calcarisporiella thermophila TaxID=911321 RepID=UPI0037439EE3
MLEPLNNDPFHSPPRERPIPTRSLNGGGHGGGDDSWKAVGSPPRRLSSSITSTTPTAIAFPAFPSALFLNSPPLHSPPLVPPASAPASSPSVENRFWANSFGLPAWSPADKVELFSERLPTMPEEEGMSGEEMDPLGLAGERRRSRSKSSAAAFGGLRASQDLTRQGAWSGGWDPSFLTGHRRASTTSSASPLVDLTGEGQDSVQRRLSMAPVSSAFQKEELSSLEVEFGQRRHSISTTMEHIPDSALHSGIPQAHSPTTPTSTLGEAKSGSPELQEMGRGIPLYALPPNHQVCVVEFKAGRTDIFYAQGFRVQTGDLVIVEADRGNDLGKVVNDHADVEWSGADPASQKTVRAKRIFRLAQPGEVTSLISKSYDEAKAMSVCLSKVRAKNMQMEVVDAEFQWDRRKLTFYFVAEHRIDFRDLVRDLFKIYKTRIWMCAVDPVTYRPKSNS